MSIWGVANPFPVPQAIVPATDITLTAGTEVLIATTNALIGPNGADAYPDIRGAIACLMGGTAPTALQFAARFNGGSDFATYVVEPGLLVNSAEFMIPLFFVGVVSGVNFSGAGKVVEITGKATTTACTIKKVGTSILVGIQQGPDA